MNSDPGIVSGTSCNSSLFDSSYPYILFAISTLEQSSSTFQGNIAAGGSVELTDFTFSCEKPATLSAGGRLVLKNCQNSGGSVCLSPLPADFSQLTDHFLCTSKSLALLKASENSQIINCSGTVFLFGQQEDYNVFHMDADNLASVDHLIGDAVSCNSLSSISSLVITVPISSTVLLNVTGKNICLGSFQTYYNSLVPSVLPMSSDVLCENLEKGSSPSVSDKKRTLWNFPDTSSITINEQNLSGSLLAPSSVLYSNGGSVHGTVVVHSLFPYSRKVSSHIDIFRFPFSGYLPEIPAVSLENTTPLFSPALPVTIMPPAIPTVPKSTVFGTEVDQISKYESSSDCSHCHYQNCWQHKRNSASNHCLTDFFCR